jgi:two-component system NtrC family sensor kinase
VRRNPKVKARSNPTSALIGADQAADLSLCRSIFDASPLPTATVVEAEHTVRYVNPSFCQLVGKNEDELIGKPFAEIMPGNGSLSLLDRVYRTGEAETYTEPEHAEAQTVFWSYLVWPFLGADERPVGVIIQVEETARFHQQAIAVNQELLLSGVRLHELAEVAEELNAKLQQEMADRKRMEHALLNSEKLAATARLASTMSHEINNPLGAITNLIYLLAPLQTSPEAQTYVAMLDGQVKRLTRIATQMLKFHRDSNQPTQFRLDELLRDALDFYHPQAERQQINVTQCIETEGIVEGFRGEVIQVVTNLLLNALEATPAGGRVSFHLYPAPPWLCGVHKRCGYCLSVADSGGGIDAQNYARIFEPFFTTKNDNGSGLGLWLCTSIVSRVGGSIRVWSSRLPNRSGSCFAVFFPADEASFNPRRRRYER